MGSGVLEPGNRPPTLGHQGIMLSLTLLLALVACGPHDPVAALRDRVADTGVVADLETMAPPFGLAVVVTPERVSVVPVGSFEGWEEGLRELLEAPVDLPVRDGVFPEHQQRGYLVEPLYVALEERAEAWKAHGELLLIEEEDFDGDLLWVVDRRVPFAALRPMLYTGGQAQYSDFDLVSFGSYAPSDSPLEASDSAVPSERLHVADATERSDPATGLRRGRLPVQWEVTDPDLPAPLFEVDDRGATFTISTPRNDELSPTVSVDERRMDGILRADIGNPVLHPSFEAAAAAAAHPVLPSLELLLQLSKRADDRLMAALERHEASGRDAWIERLTRAALERGGDEPVLSWLAAAALLGGQEPASWGVKDTVLDAARARVDAFRAQPLRSKAIGIYGEAPDLRAVFERDRFLLSPLDTRRSDERSISLALHELLHADSGLAEPLHHARGLQAMLTNPSREPAVFELEPDALPPQVWLIPPATSREVELVNSLGGTAVVGANTMEVFVRAIQDGTVSLSPREDSGWYDYQQWALEPLLTLPEREVLTADEGYQERLEDAFEAAVATRRETHVKSLQLPSIGAAWTERVRVTVAPDLRVEPLPTHFQRSAVAYDFLFAAVLEPRFDAAWEAWEGGSVAEDLREAQERYRDAAVLARADLGLDNSDPGDVADTAAWLDSWDDDPRLADDVRFMIPFGEDAHGNTLAWTVLGVKAVDITVAYEQPPAVRSLDPGFDLDVDLVEARYTLLATVFAELPVAEILDREAFRALADEHPTQRSLVRALAPVEAPSPSGCGGAS